MTDKKESLMKKESNSDIGEDSFVLTVKCSAKTDIKEKESEGR